MDDTFYDFLLDLPFPSAIYEGLAPYKKIFTNKAYDQVADKYDEAVEKNLNYMFANGYKTYIDVINHKGEILYINAKASSLKDGNFIVYFSSLKADLIRSIAKDEFNSFQYDPSTKEIQKTYASNITRTVLRSTGYNYPESLREDNSLYKDDVELYIKSFNDFLKDPDTIDTKIDVRLGENANYVSNTISLNKMFDDDGNIVSIIGASENTQMTVENKNRYNALLQNIKINADENENILSSLIINISKNTLVDAFGRIKRYSNFKGINIDRLYNLLVKTSLLSENQKIYKREEILSEYLNGNPQLTCNISFISHTSALDLCLKYETVRDVNTGDIICFIFVTDITVNNIIRKISDYINKYIYEEVIYLDSTTGFYYLFNKKSKKTVFNTSFDDSINNNSFILNKNFSKNEKLINFLKLENLNEKLALKSPYSISANLFDQDNVERNYILTADYISEGKIIILIVDNSDIMTLEKEKAKVLKEALKEAEIANVSKLTFLNNMSHDLRTPLTTVLNTADLALNEVSDKTSISYFNDIKTSGSYLLNIINDVLQMSRLQSNRISSIKEICNLKSFADDILKIIKPLATLKKLNLILDFQFEGNLSINFDEIHTKQILINLLSNAIKYTDHGFVKWSLYIVKDSGLVTLKSIVEDSGIGINSNNLDIIFDSFVRESDVENKKNGTGLGLAITKNLINLLDGDIQVESIKTKGSTFTINIPVQISKELKITKNIDLDYSKLAGKKVLIAEDNKVNSKILTKILSKYDLECTVAINGLDAINKYNDSFDFVLMDIRMPIMNGLEAAKGILNKSSKDIPIIALSANAFEEDIASSLACGMKEHLTKPIKTDILMTTLLKYC
jgi:signal transduction histidine kinase/BarA-like signal transduction histidine kinase